MRYKSIAATAFLIIPFCFITSASAEIFELVNNFDINVVDIEAADFNNDDLEDFAVTEWIADSSYYEVFLSNGDCSFEQLAPVFADTANIARLLTGDFNEDANEDILLINLEGTRLYFGDGTGGFSLYEMYPWSLCNGCAGDINNDGHLDIVGITKDSKSWRIYDGSIVVMLGDGTGGFAEGWVYEDYGLRSCQLAYFDNSDTDTVLDLCVTTYDDIFLVFQGEGDGSFINPKYYQPETSGWEGPTLCACGDFDEDGYADIAVTGIAGMSSPSTLVFLNQQNSTFVQIEPGYFWGLCESLQKIATADLDLDGHLDLSLEGSIAGFGDGTFNGDWYEYLSHLIAGNYVFIDMDLDGDLDCAKAGNKVAICRNTTITQGCEEGSEGSFMNLVLDVSPNPFSSFVSIEVSGNSDGSGNLEIFDLSGRKVAELEAVSSDGEVVFHWDGVSSSGVELPSGIYTARLRSGNIVATASLLKLE